MRELEEKRINKEMANIRKKFKGHYSFSHCLATGWLTGFRADGNLDGYQKKKYDMKCSRLPYAVLKIS